MFFFSVNNKFIETSIFNKKGIDVKILNSKDFY